jgi:hypothetical protein
MTAEQQAKRLLIPPLNEALDELSISRLQPSRSRPSLYE